MLLTIALAILPQDCSQSPTPPLGITHNHFGTSVEIQRDTLVVSGFFQGVGPGAPGRVDFFERLPGEEQWDFVQRYEPQSPVEGVWTGETIDLDGDRVALSSPFQRTHQINGFGAVHLMTRNAGTWTVEQIVAPQPSETSRFFGSALSLDGDRLAVAGGDAHHGEVFLFERDAASGVWSEVQRIVSPDTWSSIARSIRFGGALALDGDSLLIGYPARVGASIDEGAAFLYQLSSSTGQYEFMQELTPVPAPTLRYYGRTVSLDGDVAVVGRDWGGPFGRANVFRSTGSGGHWIHQQELLRSLVPGSGNGYGTQVLAEGGKIVVTSPHSSAVNYAVAHLYLENGGVWERTRGYAIDNSETGRAATKISFDGDSLAVGIGGSYYYPADGRVNTHRVGPDTNQNGVADACESVGTEYCSQIANGQSLDPGRAAALGSSSLLDDDLMIVGWSLPVGAPGYLLNSMQPASTPLPGISLGVLCLGGPSVGRHASGVQFFGADGFAFQTIDLTSIPQPTGFVVASAGETWNFQWWFRDTSASTGQITSNFSSAVAVTLR